MPVFFPLLKNVFYFGLSILFSQLECSGSCEDAFCCENSNFQKASFSQILVLLLKAQEFSDNNYPELRAFEAVTHWVFLRYTRNWFRPFRTGGACWCGFGGVAAALWWKYFIFSFILFFITASHFFLESFGHESKKSNGQGCKRWAEKTWRRMITHSSKCVFCATWVKSHSFFKVKVHLLPQVTVTPTACWESWWAKAPGKRRRRRRGSSASGRGGKNWRNAPVPRRCCLPGASRWPRSSRRLSTRCGTSTSCCELLFFFFFFSH